MVRAGTEMEVKKVVIWEMVETIVCAILLDAFWDTDMLFWSWM